MGKPKRARTARREGERALRREVGARERLAGLGPGGSAERAIIVRSASQVEVQARSTPCVQCGGELELRDHSAPLPSLRLARLVCRRCHTPRELWFRLETPLPS
jgi:hypothetical protein